MFPKIKLKTSLSPLKIFIWTSKLYGCFPFRIKQSIGGDFVFSISKLECVYGTLLVLLTTIYCLVFHHDLSGKSVIDYVLEANAVVVSICTLITFFSYLFAVKKIQKIYEESFLYFKYVNDENFRVKLFLLMIIEIFIYQVMTISAGVSYYLAGTSGSEIILILDVVADYHMRFVLSFVSHQFNNLVLYFSEVFKIVNRELEVLGDKKDLWLIKRTKRTDGNFLISDDEDLTDLADFYDGACGLCDEIDEAFGISSLVTSFLTFLQTLGPLYAFIVDGNVALFICWFGYHVFHFWIFLYSCEVTDNEVS